MRIFSYVYWYVSFKWVEKISSTKALIQTFFWLELWHFCLTCDHEQSWKRRQGWEEYSHVMSEFYCNVNLFLLRSSSGPTSLHLLEMILGLFIEKAHPLHIMSFGIWEWAIHIFNLFHIIFLYIFVLTYRILDLILLCPHKWFLSLPGHRATNMHQCLHQYCRIMWEARTTSIYLKLWEIV